MAIISDAILVSTSHHEDDVDYGMHFHVFEDIIS